MRLSLRAVAATATAVLAAGVATPAAATSTAYCNPATNNVQGVSGTVLYNPPVLSPTVPTLTNWKFDLTLTCNFGAAKATGTYKVKINGTSSEICANGGGGGGVVNPSSKSAGVGVGPIVNGNWQYSRFGLHYYGYPQYGDGNIYVQESPVTFQHYKMYLWLDLLPYVANGNCPGAGGDIIGHGTMIEP